MTAFYLALLAALIAGFGARDQVTVAALAARQSGHVALLVMAVLSSIGTALFAGYAAILFLDILAPMARLFMAALALLLAGLESIIIRPRAKMKEPTQSLGAAMLVIVASQLTDAARFLIFGIAIATGQVWSAAAGGALAGIALMGMAWSGAELVVSPKTRQIRRAAGVVLILVALYTGLVAVGIL
ncbi:MAG: hypothetical protein R3D89_10075 [Sphingomonadaceae bacterium]